MGHPLETLTRYGTEEEQKIAEINPLRYRGYYYDSETGYYYLQSRYYNPEWGRFISPDSFDYIDNTTQLGCNAYVYCLNIPVMYSDYTGTSALAGGALATLFYAIGSAMGELLIVTLIILIIFTFGLASSLLDSISLSFGKNKTLSDVKAKEIDNQGHYRVAYINKYGELTKIGKN